MTNARGQSLEQVYDGFAERLITIAQSLGDRIPIGKGWEGALGLLSILTRLMAWHSISPPRTSRIR